MSDSANDAENSIMGANGGEDLECSYLIPQDILEQYSVRIVEGDKAGAKLLVVIEQYVFHRNDTSLDGDQVYWECARIKQFRYTVLTIL